MACWDWITTDPNAQQSIGIWHGAAPGSETQRSPSQLVGSGWDQYLVLDSMPPSNPCHLSISLILSSLCPGPLKSECSWESQLHTCCFKFLGHLWKQHLVCWKRQAPQLLMPCTMGPSAWGDLKSMAEVASIPGTLNSMHGSSGQVARCEGSEAFCGI